jgi:ATP-dependent Zn protease
MRSRVTRKLSQLEKVAYHEAGHASLAFWQQIAVRYVTVVEDIDSLGHFTHWPKPSFRPDIKTDLRTRARIENHARVSLAGVIAEARATGRRRNWRGAHTDLRNACDLVSYLTVSAEHLNVYLRLLWIETEGMLATPHHWKAVEALAADLVKRRRMNGTEVKEVLRGELWK